MSMQVETHDLRQIGEADARAIAELLVIVWPKPGRTVETMAGQLLERAQLRHWDELQGEETQHPRSFIVRERGRIIAHATAFPRTILTDAGELTVLALARVCTDPAARGRRLGEAVVRAAFDLVDQGVFPFSLFQTTEPVRPFYEKLGAVRVENSFINSRAEDPRANPWWNEVIMRYPAREGWPEGEIDLRGPGW